MGIGVPRNHPDDAVQGQACLGAGITNWRAGKEAQREAPYGEQNHKGIIGCSNARIISYFDTGNLLTERNR